MLLTALTCEQGLTYVSPSFARIRVRLLTTTQKKAQTTKEQDDASWKEKYGEEGAKLIRETVDESMENYEYLKQFAIKV